MDGLHGLYWLDRTYWSNRTNRLYRTHGLDGLYRPRRNGVKHRRNGSHGLDRLDRLHGTCRHRLEYWCNR